MHAHRTFCVFLASILATVANAADLSARHADYVLLRDDRVVGEASYTLTRNGPREWTLIGSIQAHAGMARLAGLDLRERSDFIWVDGAAHGVRYELTQHSAFKQRHRTIDFAATAGEAHVRDDGKDYHYPIPPDAIDRNTVAIALGAARIDGAREVVLHVAQRDHVEAQRFTFTNEEVVRVPAGRFTAVRVERVDAPGKLRAWYAPNLGPLPLRLEQIQGDGSVLVLALREGGDAGRSLGR
jgi:hypothetical protein